MPGLTPKSAKITPLVQRYPRRVRAGLTQDRRVRTEVRSRARQNRERRSWAAEWGAVLRSDLHAFGRPRRRPLCRAGSVRDRLRFFWLSCPNSRSSPHDPRFPLVHRVVHSPQPSHPHPQRERQRADRTLSTPLSTQDGGSSPLSSSFSADPTTSPASPMRTPRPRFCSCDPGS